MAPRPPLVVQKCSNCDWQKLLVFLGFSLALRVIGAEEPPSSFAHQMTRWLSPASRMDGQRVSQLEGRLGQLPPFSPGHSGHAKGFHSRFQPAPDTPLDLTIDLGQAYEVDRIAIFPVQGMFRGAMIKGYGFPEQFVVELSQERGFSNPVLALDSSLPGAPPRPDYPRQFVLGEPVLARYLRLRVLNHWRREDGEFLSAFGEVMVLSEGRNVALYADVEADSFTTLPDWYRDHLVDGQTDLGLPVSPEPSPSNGFLSRGARQRFTEKWVQVELPRLADIEEVSLIPAQPVDAPDQFGHGFPRKFRLLVSEDPEFERSKVIADY
ncbi:MAG: discoidin domain-containing protein, partial [Verrucomicrobiota bacterium]